MITFPTAPTRLDHVVDPWTDVTTGTQWLWDDWGKRWTQVAAFVAKTDESYTVTPRVELKAFDANSASIDSVVDTLATLLATLKSKNVI